MDFLSLSDAWLGRVCFERGLAALFFLAFLSARNQFPALLGQRGLLPVPVFLMGRKFSQAPSLFHWHYSDRFFAAVAWIGMILSLAIALGALSRAPLGVPLASWLLLTFLYLSIMNVGQRFYSFGWESMLVEAGFLAAFLTPQSLMPSAIPILLLRWLLFRVELGAGLIKIRAGGPWKDLTALIFHHETQPMPNPFSRLVHNLPHPFLKGGVVFSHFVQLVVPFGLFFPQPIAGIAAALIILHQLLLITFGNYACLNWLTIVLAFSALPNDWLSVTGLSLSPEFAARPMAWDVILVLLLLFTAWLSIKPIRNLFSRRQLMNYSFNRWHFVNTYGAFGSVTKERYEIVIEGTDDEFPGAGATWRAYEFKGKPGDPSRRPPQVAPYHLRLDWLMWFLPLRVRVLESGISPPSYEPWFLCFLLRLFRGDKTTLKLLRHNPFPDQPPRYLRARLFRYRFAPLNSGVFWNRTCVADYLSPITQTRLKLFLENDWMP